MRIVDPGKGPAIVLVPGIQGRWEHLRPAIDVLAESFRVITFPLSGEPDCGRPFEAARGFDNVVDQIGSVLDDRGLGCAVVCGISFGGLAAIRFAAQHKDRVAALVLASTPGPAWRVRRRHRFYATLPRLLGPLFIAETPSRVWREIRIAIPDRDARWRFVRQQLRTLVGAPLSLSRMAARAKLLGSHDLSNDCAEISAPTLVVSGESHLDRVVPADGTSAYAQLIQGAVVARLERTGHLGSITWPLAFASVVETFVRQCRHAAA